MLIFWHVICIVMEPNIYIDLGTVTLGLFKFHDILLCELVYFQAEMMMTMKMTMMTMTMNEKPCMPLAFLKKRAMPIEFL